VPVDRALRESGSLGTSSSVTESKPRLSEERQPASISRVRVFRLTALSNDTLRIQDTGPYPFC